MISETLSKKKFSLCNLKASWYFLLTFYLLTLSRYLSMALAHIFWCETFVPPWHDRSFSFSSFRVHCLLPHCPMMKRQISLSSFLLTASALRWLGVIVRLAIKVEASFTPLAVAAWVAVGWGNRKAFLIMFLILAVKRCVDCPRNIFTTCSGNPASTCLVNSSTSFHYTL